MPKRSKKRSKARRAQKAKAPVALDPQQLFGGSGRYKQTSLQGPKFPGLLQVCSYVNKIDGYVTKTMERIGNIKWLWHGTKAHCVASIAQTGLLSPNRKRWRAELFGRGIYLAPSEHKAISYTARWADSYCYLLRCQAALGKPFYPEESGCCRYKVDGETYHSVYAGTNYIKGVYAGSLANAEVVIYNPEQVTVNEIYVYEVVTQKEDGFRSLPLYSSLGKPIKRSKILDYHPCKRNGEICVNAYIQKQRMRCIALSKACTMGSVTYCQSYESRSKKFKRN